MSVQLDWRIEADQQRKRQLPEDPEDRSRRYGRLLRLVVMIGILLGIAGAVVFLVGRRLEQVDARLEQLLRDTVDAEVAALRIGDQKTFMEIQRSATNDWLLAQEAAFNAYQARKMGSDLQLTGRVADVAIDGQRARVLVEEIENGVPYLRAWFYWRYDETVIDAKPIPGGWHHVPPDYTFWGEEAALQQEWVEVRYRAVDAAIAQSMAAELNDWMRLACGALACGDLPPLTVDILPITLPDMAWAESATAWQMVVPSPYIERARADKPFDTAYRIEAATLLANRLVDTALQGRVPVYPSDAHYLRSAVVAWLVGRFVGLDTGAYLIESLYQRHGQARVGQLLQLLQPENDLGVLVALLGIADLAQADLDWRDYLTWRLATEDDLILKRDEARWQQFVAMETDALRTAAYGRYNAPEAIQPKVVSNVAPTTSAEGPPQLRATVRIGANTVYREDYITFTLVGHTWRRSG